MLSNPSERITVVSVMVTTALGTAELFSGLIFGTVAFMAAGLDALFDTITSIVVLGGLRVSARPPDRDHRYGHRQAETLVSVALAVILLIVGVRMAWISVERIFSPVEVVVSDVLPLLAGVSVVLLGLLASQKIRIGRKMGNPSVVADGYHTLTDAVSSFSILIGILAVAAGYQLADPMVGLFVSGLIIFWALKLSKESADILMGASPGGEIISSMKKASMEVEGVRGCHRLRARRVGSKIIGDLHVQVSPGMSVRESHKVATRVERRLKRKIPSLSSVMVHIEPEEAGKNAKKRIRGKS
ncbi:MAG: cation diffusion facilitator family transporter [Candidatus Hadarchaeales archaeon]